MSVGNIHGIQRNVGCNCVSSGNKQARLCIVEEITMLTQVKAIFGNVIHNKNNEIDRNINYYY